jgi:hypothetical protein
VISGENIEMLQPNGHKTTTTIKDAKWWQCVIWTFDQGELKLSFIV